MSLRAPVQGALVKPVGQGAFQHRLQSALPKALAYALDGGRGGFEHRGDLPVEEFAPLGVVFAGVGFQHYPGPVELSGRSAARSEELEQELPLLRGEFDDVLLLLLDGCPHDSAQTASRIRQHDYLSK
jgi:hypothetical protein